jgi:hypothetical protein
MSKLDKDYKQKYLKYKAKYAELKRYEQLGGLFDSGFSTVFTSSENADKLRKAISAGEIKNKDDIANLLDRQAYIVFDGKKIAELLKTTNKEHDKNFMEHIKYLSESHINADMRKFYVNQLNELNNLPIVINNSNSESFDHKNDSHLHHMSWSVAQELSRVDFNKFKDGTTSVFIEFKLLGKPELRN